MMLTALRRGEDLIRSGSCEDGRRRSGEVWKAPVQAMLALRPALATARGEDIDSLQERMGAGADQLDGYLVQDEADAKSDVREK